MAKSVMLEAFFENSGQHGVVDVEPLEARGD